MRREEKLNEVRREEKLNEVRREEKLNEVRRLKGWNTSQGIDRGGIINGIHIYIGDVAFW